MSARVSQLFLKAVTFIFQDDACQTIGEPVARCECKPLKVWIYPKQFSPSISFFANILKIGQDMPVRVDTTGISSDTVRRIYCIALYVKMVIIAVPTCTIQYLKL